MNQETKNKIGDFIISNFGKIISILLLIHIFIGFGFLLYNRIKNNDIKYRYEIEDKEKQYKSNEVYFGDEFILFFEGADGTYEVNENTVKIYSYYVIDTIDNKIKIITKDTTLN
jgi:hypothetical protein